MREDVSLAAGYFIVLIIWLPEAGTVISFTEGPRFLLTVAARRIPEERRDWGAAMLAELDQIDDAASRWRFALGCTRVALFPPRKDGLLQTIRSHTMKSMITTLRSAAIISFLLMLPFMVLDFWFQIVNKPTAISGRNYRDFIMLFGLMWLLLTAFIVTLVPIVRTVRAGNSITASPFALLFKVAFLALIATIWGWGFIDQLPCFLGVPNCD